MALWHFPLYREVYRELFGQPDVLIFFKGLRQGQPVPLRPGNHFQIHRLQCWFKASKIFKDVKDSFIFCHSQLSTQLPPGSLCYIIRPSQIIELLRGWDAAYWSGSIWCVSSRNKCLNVWILGSCFSCQIWLKKYYTANLQTSKTNIYRTRQNSSYASYSNPLMVGLSGTPTPRHPFVSPHGRCRHWHTCCTWCVRRGLPWPCRAGTKNLVGDAQCGPGMRSSPDNDEGLHGFLQPSPTFQTWVESEVEWVNIIFTGPIGHLPVWGQRKISTVSFPRLELLLRLPCQMEAARLQANPIPSWMAAIQSKNGWKWRAQICCNQVAIWHVFLVNTSFVILYSISSWSCSVSGNLCKTFAASIFASWLRSSIPKVKRNLWCGERPKDSSVILTSSRSAVLPQSSDNVTDWSSSQAGRTVNFALNNWSQRLHKNPECYEVIWILGIVTTLFIPTQPHHFVMTPHCLLPKRPNPAQCR